MVGTSKAPSHVPVILLVGEEEQTRFMMRQRLEAEGFIVSEASTCEAAIALAAEADLVLLNRVQDLDESTAIQRLRERAPGTPLILTAPARLGRVAALEGV